MMRGPRSVTPPQLQQQPSYPPSKPQRTRPDLRLAESYIPALIVWLKGMFYTGIGPAILMYHDVHPTMHAGVFIVALYFDHIYAPWSGFIDSTAIATDVVAGVLSLTLVQLTLSHTSLIDAMQVEGCRWCLAVSVLWAILGAVHVNMGQAHVPRPLAHALLGSVLLAALVLPPARPHNMEDVWKGGGAAIVGLLGPFYIRSAVYLLLVLIDCYLLRPNHQRERDRLNLVRYGSTLFAVWQVSLCAGAVLVVSQVVVVLKATTTSAATAGEGDATTAAIITINDAQEPKSILHASTASSQDPEMIKAMEDFKKAKAQYMIAKGN